jgi:HAD superfamily hydrolase (TIGR01509 family)
MQDLPDKRSQKRAMVKGVIFDLDGTVVDSNDLHVEAWNQAFQHFGKHFSNAKLRRHIGKGSDQYLPEFLTPAELQKIGKQIDEYRSKLFREKFLPRVKPFPRVRELFERIKQDGKRIALATSSHKDDVQTYTDLARISDLVDGETTADDTDKSKPAPDVFEAAIKRLGVPVENLMAIGDTRFDVEAAKKIGLRTIGFLCGRAADEETLCKAGAIAIYEDPADLLENYDNSPLST